jgi:hypothetical protein
VFGSKKLVPCVEQPATEECLVKVFALLLVKCVVYCYSYRLEILLFIFTILYLVTCFSFAIPGVSNLNAVTDCHWRNMSSHCFLRQKLAIRVVTVDITAQCLFQYNHVI